MTFWVIARRLKDSPWNDIHSWRLAPWNDGKGGQYMALAEVSATDVGIIGELSETFFDDFLELLGDLPEVTENPENVLMLLGLDDGCPFKCVPLTDAVALNVRGHVASIRVVPQKDERAARRNQDAGIHVPIGKQSWTDRLVRKTDWLALRTDRTSNEIVWVRDGGYAAWRDAMETQDWKNAEEKEKRITAAAQSAIQVRHDNRDSFINPYTFVPLPEKVERSEPRGHAKLAHDGYSGAFDWVLTLQTPLLLPSDDADTATESILEYPGSSLRGALRSLHESLAGGCMRALDEDYVPVHRETMNALQSGDQLVVVRETDPMTDRVTKVELTDNLTWVNAAAIHNVVAARDLRSGSTISGVEVDRISNIKLRRFEIDRSSHLRNGQEWAIHLTESNPSRDKDNHNYYAATGRLTGEVVPVEEAVWKRFVSDCAGSRDLIGSSAPISSTAQGTWPEISVRHFHDGREKLVGRRRRVDGWLSVGDTVWLTKDGRLKMAAIWRRSGEMSVKDRLPSTSLRPCSDPDELCPTCAVFGSVSTERSEDNDQAGYATHIHVGWGQSRKPDNPNATATVSPRDVQIAPLRNPKPSSGGFYLEAPGQRTASSDENHVPRAHWRAASDPQNTPRKIRGRKQYWHGQVATTSPTPRQTARNHHLRDRNGKVQAGERREIPSGTVISSHISFDNLSAEQLAWLLAAANPTGYFSHTEETEHICWVHIGGGKPLGYGSALPMIENLQVFSARSRYGEEKGSNFDLETAWVHAQKSAASRDLTTTHKALKKILTPNAVHADRIWYPTTQNFDRQGGENFDKSFEWFSKHSGGRLIRYDKGRTGPDGRLVPLPDVLDDDQYLESWEDQ